ncbi:hypothetical protein Amir_5082 [Actinosynnema mirum DSM 43827]|uniref:Uncharacterized protein n=1 Tax=Actinosynnema mirum (strain ATCC 29888 / DSM 43827 / JCM 3225 / NBRC 14064 / NCIMB 13271 / NRRL B-12336 / IMRU 3971 / 101) TaxID=446462 RepID=C6WS84_ACTMD|nr:hypothetical protein Amir_5082 [Actinosynnema mirum DSM 43827]
MPWPVPVLVPWLVLVLVPVPWCRVSLAAPIRCRAVS